MFILIKILLDQEAPKIRYSNPTTFLFILLGSIPESCHYSRFRELLRSQCNIVNKNFSATVDCEPVQYEYGEAVRV